MLVVPNVLVEPGTAVPLGWMYFPPLLILKLVTVGAVVPVVVEPLAIVSVLNVVTLVPLIDCAAPFIVTVLAPVPVNAPVPELFDQLPVTPSVLVVPQLRVPLVRETLPFIW